MKKITKINGVDVNYIARNQCCNYNTALTDTQLEATKQQCIDKLSQLEEIEKELGIDLITLFKALKNGVYVVNYDNEIIFEEPMISFNQEKGTNLYVLDSICEIPPNKFCEYYLKDYGKTWALTKEELENEK